MQEYHRRLGRRLPGILGVSRSADWIISFLDLGRTDCRLCQTKNYLKDIQDPKIYNFGKKYRRLLLLSKVSVSILDTCKEITDIISRIPKVKWDHIEPSI